MNQKVKSIIRRALKNGFDLSTILNYEPKLFKNKLYMYLIQKKYFCFEEEDVIVVSDYTLDDLAELVVGDYHLKINTIRTEGIFDLLIEIFRFIADNPDLKPEDEVSTEEVIKNEIDSEDLDWI